ncbi:MAG: hypothetical protein GF368_03400 [Candidatus Aenigmarchaeota archaeon]|nr:hypothetical protein [Candidatus Aenigmarchaeota archaeon]
MKNKIFAILAALLTLAPVFAVTDVELYIHNDGEVEFWEHVIGPAGYASNYEEVLPTASITEHIVNHGTIDIFKKTATFGTGKPWPERNSANQPYGDTGEQFGEWSLYEEKEVQATGETWKNKYVNIWTVHPDWFTNFGVYEVEYTPTMTKFEVSAEGTAGTGEGGEFYFEKHVYTDEPLMQKEVVWVNPWVDVINSDGYPTKSDPWDNDCFDFPERPPKEPVTFCFDCPEQPE